jgi:hypothetical protein
MINNTYTKRSIAVQRRSLVGDVGNLLGGITQGVVVDVVTLEAQLTTLLGPIVQTVNLPASHISL